jgi:hypothetical protein
MTLFAGNGAVLAEWCENQGRRRTPSFSTAARSASASVSGIFGPALLHVVGAAGHDVVKYALDTFGDASLDKDGSDSSLSCTHDANAWPADRYAGLPAPAPGEQVLLWIQNSHPIPIPACAIGLNVMGEECVVPITDSIAPFATHAVEIPRLLPDTWWPKQIEVRAGKHMVRPRYEVIERGRRRIAHVNVERVDLTPDPELPRLGGTLGKGYLLPAPVLPEAVATQRRRWLCVKPSFRLPLAFTTRKEARSKPSFGRLPRAHATLRPRRDEGIDAARGPWPYRAGL